jgi:Phage tail sheath protein subtilisin-like domain/Phage tail sheath C-terminal domain
MATLVVPGVSVEARFDVLPPLPAPAGILGAVGIVDRPPPDGELVTVTMISEVRDLLGPGTEATMPEVMHALRNGTAEAVISAVAGGGPASVPLLNANSAPAVILRARSNGEWGNELRADVRGIANAAGAIVRIRLRILRDGRVVEDFTDLQMAPGQPDDLFETINRRSRLLVALDPGFQGLVPRENTYAFGDEGEPIPVPRRGGTRTLFELLPEAEVDPAGLSVRIEIGDGDVITVLVFQGGLQEEFTDLGMDPDGDRYLPYVLLTQSRLVRVRPQSSLDEGERLPRATDAPLPFTGGTSPSVQAYQDAIDRLGEDSRINLLVASIEPGRSVADTRQIHQALLAQAVAMAEDGAPRIAFGSVTREEQGDLGQVRDHAATVRNRRFVLVSPAGGAGAVAGLVSRLDPEESPTFKQVPLFEVTPARYRQGELNRLLSSAMNVLVVQDRPGRGVIVLKGIDTTGDQVSVTRVADVAIRETKAICENFIGVLNSEEARTALKQQIVATFTRMEREGALVPSTDGSDPAFLVDVYSTQQDFAQGIVRVDIAVRPVRAIDYVYATIRVKN